VRFGGEEEKSAVTGVDDVGVSDMNAEENMRERPKNGRKGGARRGKRSKLSGTRKRFVFHVIARATTMTDLQLLYM
jgi:hypothetical protein